MSTKYVLGLLGSVLLFIGVFLPLVSVPIAGDINYFRNGEGDGIFILVFAGGSFVLVLAQQYRLLWATGLASLGLLGYTFWNFRSGVNEARSKMGADLADNPFRGLADAAAQSVQLEWGWAVLVVGAALVLAAAALPENYDKKR